MSENIIPVIRQIPDKKIIGLRKEMSLANYQPGELWRNFLPNRKKISNNLNNELISMSVYSNNYFRKFDPDKSFDKWAAVEVTDHDSIPDHMEAFVIVGGHYAVFDYKGSGTDNAIFQYIYGTWLPGSGFTLDHRPHFEILGDKYINNNPSSEEEIWIPVKDIII